MPPRRTGWESRTVALILLVYSAVMAASMVRQSPTLDEGNHYGYGLMVSRMDTDLGPHDSKMPFSVVNTIPHYLSLACAHIPWCRWVAPCLDSLNAARFVTICFTVLMAWYVFRWSRALHGTRGAFFSLLLVVLDPNIMAHGSLVTTDLFLSLMVIVALHRYWIFLNKPSIRNALWSAMTLGLALLSKHTAVSLYPLFVVLLVIHRRGRPTATRHGPPHRQIAHLGRITGFMVLFMGISLLVLNAGFLFNRPFMTLSDHEFKSEHFRTLQRAPGLNRIPLPLPGPFVEGLDRVRHNDATGGKIPGIYLRGEVRHSGSADFKGFKTYYLWCYLLKVPLAIQCIVILAFVRVLGRKPRPSWRGNEAFLLIPALFFIVYFSLFFNTQIGIRFILPVFPLLYVFCGSLLREGEAASIRLRVACAGLLFYAAASVASYAPHFIPYFNELVPDRTKAYRYLADSNLDWGQAASSLHNYLLSHPGSTFHPPRPTKGRILVDANALVGLPDPEWFRWLRENFDPVGHVGYAVIMFEVTDQDLWELDRRARATRSPRNHQGTVETLAR